MCTAGKDPREEFKASRIPGSRFFDVDKISDPNTDLPHMLPSAAAFAAAADALNISADDQVNFLAATLAWLGLINSAPELRGIASHALTIQSSACVSDSSLDICR